MLGNKHTDAFEIAVSGPFALNSAESSSLTWLARAGTFHLGSVRLQCHMERHTAVLREFHLPEKERLQVLAMLLSAVAEYAREQGILKIKVHRSAAVEGLSRQITRLGFNDAGKPDAMQFYLDLYRSPRRRKAQPATETSPDSPRLQC